MLVSLSPSIIVFAAIGPLTARYFNPELYCLIAHHSEPLLFARRKFVTQPVSQGPFLDQARMFAAFVRTSPRSH
ncbi:hypothetical protein V1517DRAFT_313710 [Lipomyces orientalis]|uniref:Uncharacterized protein n=1 Tax=Lipomyces orientalis TaxID=1233043 RepID=A0ACC3TX36_9ASCO